MQSKKVIICFAAILLVACSSLALKEYFKGRERSRVLQMISAHDSGGLLDYLDQGGSPFVALIYGNDLIDVACANGWFEILKKIETKGVNFKQMSEKRFLLHSAAENGRLDVVRFLISRGFVVDQTNGFGDSPLMNTAFRSEARCLETARELIKAGANVNFISPGRGTPLSKAYQAGSAEMILLLLNAGANINTKAPWSGRLLLDETPDLPTAARNAVSNWIGIR